MIHHTRGVYADGSFKDNGVKSENLQDHIAYNKQFRPGRALFVDGKCVHHGYLDAKECEKIERTIEGIRMGRDTAPYC